MDTGGLRTSAVEKGRVDEVETMRHLSEPMWDRVIEPRRPWLDFRLRQLWRYRDLIALFVRRDFVAVYKQTILGPVWYVLQPVLTAVVFTIIFGKAANLPTDGVPPFLFYFSGIVVWRYFSE